MVLYLDHYCFTLWALGHISTRQILTSVKNLELIRIPPLLCIYLILYYNIMSSLGEDPLSSCWSVESSPSTHLEMLPAVLLDLKLAHLLVILLVLYVDRHATITLH